MEIKSGPHENEWGEKGFVVWTKTFETCAGNPYVSQNGKMFATFIKNPTGMGSIGGTLGKTVIYRDGLLMEY